LYNKPDCSPLLGINGYNDLSLAWRADDDKLIKNELIKKINKTRPLGRPKIGLLDVVTKYNKTLRYR